MVAEYVGPLPIDSDLTVYATSAMCKCELRSKYTCIILRDTTRCNAMLSSQYTFVTIVPWFSYQLVESRNLDRVLCIQVSCLRAPAKTNNR